MHSEAIVVASITKLEYKPLCSGYDQWRRTVATWGDIQSLEFLHGSGNRKIAFDIRDVVTTGNYLRCYRPKIDYQEVEKPIGDIQFTKVVLSESDWDSDPDEITFQCSGGKPVVGSDIKLTSSRRANNPSRRKNCS